MTFDAQAPIESRLEQLGYTPLPEFALLDECEFFDKKTNQHVKLDRNRLERIAESQNSRIVNRNDPTPCIVGHTQDNLDEHQQPKQVGFTTRFSVRSLPDGTSAIFARPWAAPGQVEVFRKFNRRSVELWLDPDAIDPIALLGASTPRRDLGVHLFSRDSAVDLSAVNQGSCVKFSRGNQSGLYSLHFEMTNEEGTENMFEQDKKDGDADDKGTDAIDAGVPDWAKKIQADMAEIKKFVEVAKPIFEQIIAEESEANQGGPGGPPGAPPGAGGPPAGMAGPEGPPPGAGGPPEPPVPDRAGGPDKKNMGSAAGYGNTYMPNHQFSRDVESRVMFDRLSAENEQLRAQLHETTAVASSIKMQMIEQEVDAALKEMSEEGYTIKSEVDRPYLCRLKKEDRVKAIAFMRDTRAKKPVTGALPNNGRRVMNPEDVVKPQPIQFSRIDDGFSLPGDPGITPGQIPDDYDQLVRMANAAKKRGGMDDVMENWGKTQGGDGVKVQ